MTRKQIALEFGISVPTVERCARIWGFRSRRGVPIDDSVLIEKYGKELWSMESLSVEYGYYRMWMVRRLEELGILRSSAQTIQARATRRLATVGPSVNYKKHGGYPGIPAPPGHITRAGNGKGGYTHIHVLEMEKKLGRPLHKNEMVHHIDLDKSNYQIDNLVLCENQSAHEKVHTSLDRVGIELFKKGIVGFDGKQYVINEKKLAEYIVAHEPSEIPDPIPKPGAWK